MAAYWGVARQPRSASDPCRPHSATRATTRDRPYRSTPEPRCRPRVGIRRIPHAPCLLALYRQNVPFAVRSRGRLLWAPVGVGQPRSASDPCRPLSATRATTRDRPYRSTPEPRCRPRVGIRRIPHAPCLLALYRQNVPFAVRCRGVSYGRPLGWGKATSFCVRSVPPALHHSGDHKGSPLQVTRRGATRGRMSSLKGAPG